MRETFSSRQTVTFAGGHRIKINRQTFADGTSKATLSGYPILWNAVSSDRGGYVVKLAPDSAKFTDSVLALWHHQFDKPLAGTVNQTLRILAADDVGVPVEIDLDLNTTAGRDAAAYVTSGLVSGMSFSMSKGFEDYEEQDEPEYGKVLNVTKYTVDEISLTAIPAFAETTIAPKETPVVPLPVKVSAVPASSRIEAANRLRSFRLDMLK